MEAGGHLLSKKRSVGKRAAAGVRKQGREGRPPARTPAAASGGKTMNSKKPHNYADKDIYDPGYGR